MTQELYVLGKDRSAQFAIAFLDRFLPQRKVFCEDYPVPESSDNPEIVFTSEFEILQYLEEHPNESYGLYWNDADAESFNQAMLFFTKDGKVIFGLAEDESSLASKFQQLINFVGSEYWLFGSEQRPPDTAAEFETLCRNSQ